MHYVMLIKAGSYQEVKKKMKAFEIFGANGTESKYVKEIDETEIHFEEYKKDKAKKPDIGSFKDYAECFTDYDLFHISTDMDTIDVEDKKWGYILYDDNDEVVKIVKRDNPNGHYDYYSSQHPFSAYYMKNGKSIAFGINEKDENYISLEDFYINPVGYDFYGKQEGIEISEIDLTRTFNQLYKKCKYEYDVVKKATHGLSYKTLDFFIKKYNLPLDEYVWYKEEYKRPLSEYENQEFYKVLNQIYSSKSEYKSFDRDLHIHPLIVKTWSFEKYFEYKRNAYFLTYGYIYRGKWITSYQPNEKYKGEKSKLKKAEKWAKEVKNIIFEKEKDKKIFLLDVHR